MAFRVSEPKESVCTNASAVRANIGSKTDPPVMRLDPRTIISRIATMQIANTAHAKAAFHHGSTVPYGMAAMIISPTSEPKIPLLSSFKTVSRKGAKGAKKARKEEISLCAFLCAFARELLLLARDLFGSHCHRFCRYRRLVKRKNPRCGFSEPTPKQIAQIVCINQQRLGIKSAIKIEPAPLDSILHQRQTKAPFRMRPVTIIPLPEHSPIAKFEQLFRMTLKTCLVSALIHPGASGLAHLSICKTKLSEVEQVPCSFKHLMQVRSFRQRQRSTSHPYVICNSQPPIAHGALYACP